MPELTAEHAAGVGGDHVPDLARHTLVAPDAARLDRDYVAVDEIRWIPVRRVGRTRLYQKYRAAGILA